MGRKPCCSKDEGLNRGAWSVMEDRKLLSYVQAHGEGKWPRVPKAAGLKRRGKSCRLRWLNYLRPGIKRGDFGSDEEDLIVRLHRLLGNKWALIAGRLPGRTDNEIKNYWNTVLSKKVGTLFKKQTTFQAAEQLTEDDDNGRKNKECKSESDLVQVEEATPADQVAVKRSDNTCGNNQNALSMENNMHPADLDFNADDIIDFLLFENESNHHYPGPGMELHEFPDCHSNSSGYDANSLERFLGSASSVDNVDATTSIYGDCDSDYTCFASLFKSDSTQDDWLLPGDAPFGIL